MFCEKLEKFGFVFFVGDISVGVGSRIFGQGYQALGTNPMSQFFDSRFHWKLGFNLSH